MKYVGLALGLLVAMAVAVGVIVVATASDEVLVLDLDVGDCFRLDLAPGDAEIRTVSTVDCAEPHEAEVVAVGELDPDGTTERPPDDELFARVDARCAEALADRPALAERFGILPVAADEASWASFDGRFVCVAIPFGGGTTTGSALAVD